MIRRLLIANRSEIAVRILRACKEMGIESVVAYSQADADSLAVQLADDSICIGPASAKDSYLNMHAILQAACSAGCDAIHPGYGFLSENAKFARLVQECDLTFVGPSFGLIELMGDKTMARTRMKEVGVPVVDGCEDPLVTVQQALDLADSIGYPVIIKARHGGGGRGMRIVWRPEELESAYRQARQEAKACFDNDEVYMERYIQDPKHVEVQLLADHEGHVVHLYERDCSFQRKNQKMIEEAPCSILPEEIRQNLLNDAVKAARAIGYDSVGTMEFLLDREGHYYFMEMNTRIQVEHPVTEAVTGIDLIKWQIKIAAGQKLTLKQEEIPCRGVAMECRINAEDVSRDFAPTPGKITFMHLPGGHGVRVDTAVYCGSTISPYYDSMILKLIVQAPTRLECIKKMRAALEETIIDGVKTNIEFLYLTLYQKEFIEGIHDIGYAPILLERLKKNGQFI